MKRPIVILLVVLLLSGCSKLSPYFHVANGNRHYTNGNYQTANILYIEAARSGEFEHWIAYNLGTVYYALGEVDAAAREWEIAAGSRDETLLYSVYFNHGVLLYERGSYGEAYEKFRNALEINPSGFEAKVNLELSREKMEVKEKRSTTAAEAVPPGESGGEIDRILNYLKRMEGEVWESTKELEQEPLPRDL